MYCQEPVELLGMKSNDVKCLNFKHGSAEVPAVRYSLAKQPMNAA